MTCLCLIDILFLARPRVFFKLGIQMFAVVSVNNNQHKVEEGKTYNMPLFEYDQKKKKVIFDKVMLISDDKETKVGQPYLEKAEVEAEVLGAKKTKKETATKFKAKKRYKRTFGHRQDYLEVSIIKIKK